MMTRSEIDRLATALDVYNLHRALPGYLPASTYQKLYDLAGRRLPPAPNAAWRLGDRLRAVVGVDRCPFEILHRVFPTWQWTEDSARWCYTVRAIPDEADAGVDPWLAWPGTIMALSYDRDQAFAFATVFNKWGPPGAAY